MKDFLHGKAYPCTRGSGLGSHLRGLCSENTRGLFIEALSPAVWINGYFLREVLRNIQQMLLQASKST